MALFQSILCPVDFSEHSVHALRLAVGLASRNQARLAVMTVIDELLVEAAAVHYGPDYVGQEAEKELRGLFHSLAPSLPAWVPAPRFAVGTGAPDAKILDGATAQQADVIVMGTHGLGGYRKMFFGSVTERVLRKSPVPVLAVPLTAQPLVVFSDRAPTFDLAGVMAPVDFGPGSERQIHVAAELAREFAASLLLVHVVAHTRAHGGLHDLVTAHERTRLKEARKRLTRLAPDNHWGISIDAHVACGRPADEITRIAIEHEIGLVVMGLGGEDASAGRPGSVVYRVLCMGAAPVLALPPHKKTEMEEIPKTGAMVEST
jgi:nucleotide-binding universal stress UspA family protein